MTKSEWERDTDVCQLFAYVVIEACVNYKWSGTIIFNQITKQWCHDETKFKPTVTQVVSFSLFVSEVELAIHQQTWNALKEILENFDLALWPIGKQFDSRGLDTNNIQPAKFDQNPLKQS